MTKKFTVVKEVEYKRAVGLTKKERWMEFWHCCHGCLGNLHFLSLDLLNCKNGINYLSARLLQVQRNHNSHVQIFEITGEKVPDI